MIVQKLLRLIGNTDDLRIPLILHVQLTIFIIATAMSFSLSILQ